MKSREHWWQRDIIANGFLIQILERLKVEKRIYSSEYCKIEFEIELYTKINRAAKMYELLMKFETQTSEKCMIKSIKNVGYNLQMKQGKIQD